MNTQYILNIIRNALYNVPDISHKIFRSDSIPENISDTIILLSSIDYIDLMLCIEQQFCTEFPNECMIPSKISFNELAERINKYV